LISSDFFQNYQSNIANLNCWIGKTKAFSEFKIYYLLFFHAFVIYLSCECMTWECEKCEYLKLNTNHKADSSTDFSHHSRLICTDLIEQSIQFVWTTKFKFLCWFFWCLVLTMHFVRQKCKFNNRTENLINLRIERQILQIYILGISISRNSNNREQYSLFIYLYFLSCCFQNFVSICLTV